MRGYGPGPMGAGGMMGGFGPGGSWQTGGRYGLDAQHSGLTADDATAFPGHYTLHTVHGGKIVGMMSVHAVTGAIWYHTWHGAFLARSGA